VEAQIDEEIAALKVAMEKACIADNQARNEGKPALAKLQLLPQVMRLMNRPPPVQEQVLDPETNFMQSVKYFLEPLDDGSLPAYNIQRDIFTSLTKLQLNKDTLLSSGIGKVVLFYTKSKRAELSIKRMAERLVGEWSRPILKRTDDYKKKQIETRDFDYAYVILTSVLRVPVLLSCISIIKLTFVSTVLLNCNSARKLLEARNIHCHSALPTQDLVWSRSVRVSWQPRQTQHGLDQQACQPRIRSRPGVRMMRAKDRTTVRSVLLVQRRSAR
jgi:hypothetical protein